VSRKLVIHAKNSKINFVSTKKYEKVSKKGKESTD
jgi:hypothetical protein